MIWIIIGIIFFLILAYACANAFYEIARMKGHDDKRYFWWTFSIPLLGALMVTALPDRKQTERIPSIVPPADVNRGKSKVEVIPTPPSVAPAADIPNATHVVTRHVTGKEDEIECPICGKRQRANRTVCWECGAKFNKE
ncbi:MAG: hypothetical protein IKL25_10660 [Clostridia bacterium]|nr:hypothetical protein [Clostridia bacterium]